MHPHKDMYTHREKEGRREGQGRMKEERKGKGKWPIKKWDNESGPKFGI